MVFSLWERPFWGTLGAAQSENEYRRGLSEADSGVDIRVALTSPEEARSSGYGTLITSVIGWRPSRVCALTNIASAGTYWSFNDGHDKRVFLL
jgi:hypothetical protein